MSLNYIMSNGKVKILLYFNLDSNENTSFVQHL